jgi:hypothetical protein
LERTSAIRVGDRHTGITSLGGRGGGLVRGQGSRLLNPDLDTILYVREASHEARAVIGQAQGATDVTGDGGAIRRGGGPEAAVRNILHEAGFRLIDHAKGVLTDRDRRILEADRVGVIAAVESGRERDLREAEDVHDAIALGALRRESLGGVTSEVLVRRLALQAGLRVNHRETERRLRGGNGRSRVGDRHSNRVGHTGRARRDEELHGCLRTGRNAQLARVDANVGDADHASGLGARRVKRNTLPDQRVVRDLTSLVGIAAVGHTSDRRVRTRNGHGIGRDERAVGADTSARTRVSAAVTGDDDLSGRRSHGNRVGVGSGTADGLVGRNRLIDEQQGFREVTRTGRTQQTAGDVDAGLGKDLEVDLTEVVRGKGGRTTVTLNLRINLIFSSLFFT